MLIQTPSIKRKPTFQFIGTHPNGTRNNKAFSAVLTRLHWHFIQKFEMECRYETECINSGYEILPHAKNGAFIKAWKTDNTGLAELHKCLVQN
jgi:deoxyribodipyrimidine photo-lyase